MKQLILILALTCFASSETYLDAWQGFIYGLQGDPTVPMPCLTDMRNLPYVWGNFTETLFEGKILESVYDLSDYTNKLNEAINECAINELYQKVVTSVTDSVELGVIIVRVSSNYGFYGPTFE